MSQQSVALSSYSHRWKGELYECSRSGAVAQQLLDVVIHSAIILQLRVACEQTALEQCRAGVAATEVRL